MVAISNFILTASLLSLGFASPHPRRKRQTTTKYLFSFGDSYTARGFNINGIQPGPGNAVGNPAIGSHTFSGGLVYPEYLATRYNTSFVQLYDFAYGGATISDSIVPTSQPIIDTFEEQVNLRYRPKYSTPGSAAAPWNANTGYFTVFFGINDLGHTWKTADMDQEIPELTYKYRALLNNLYGSGARKFLILGVPPVDRSARVLNNP
jgi:hypothetical protein